jgi:hypothetical protein
MHNDFSCPPSIPAKFPPSSNIYNADKIEGTKTKRSKGLVPKEKPEVDPRGFTEVSLHVFDTVECRLSMR